MNTKGFTLIEVLIGLFIAVIASISVSQVISSTNKVTDIGRKTFVATNVAHEGLELTRALRDNQWFANPAPVSRPQWMSQSGICPGAGTYTYLIDPSLNASSSLYITPASSAQALYIHSNGGLWTHQNVPNGSETVTPTLYKRLMAADCSEVASVPAVVKLTSKVSWKDAQGAAKSVSIQERLYNWLP